MFSGIIEKLGQVEKLASQPGGARLSVRAGEMGGGDWTLGESVAVNGACLTVAALEPGGLLHFDLSDETLERTTLGGLKAGAEVNLERALRVGDKLGGHFVSGHVDAVGQVWSVQGDEHGTLVRIEGPKDLMRLIAHKGSVAVDGISLTPIKVDDLGFSVAVIPHTLKATTLGSRRPGDRVNLEADLLARYVARLKEAW